jgi:transcriptional regulator with XRE-family HTH domain
VANDGKHQLVLHLRQLRGRRSLRALAEELSIRADELGRIERGETTQIRWSTLLRIATAAGGHLEGVVRVVPAAGHNEPQPWSAALEAVVDGRVPMGLPPRPDPEYAVADVLSGADGMLSHFHETDSDSGRVRRPAFRPTA